MPKDDPIRHLGTRVKGPVNPTLAALIGQDYFDVADRLRIYMNNGDHTELVEEDTHPYGDHLSKHHWDLVVGNETVRISRMEPRVDTYWYVMSTNDWCIEFGRAPVFQMIAAFFEGTREQFEETMLYAKLLIGNQ